MVAALTKYRSLLLLSHCSRSLSLFIRILHTSRSRLHSSTPLLLSPSYPASSYATRLFCSTSDAIDSSKRNPKLVNFSLSDSESDSETNDSNQTTSTAASKREFDKSKFPPPYDPFSKKPVIEEPEDPTNLQEVFHKIRTDGLFNNAVKMFDGLSKDGLTHEALELFKQIKDKGHMPDVVSHTAVIEAYANADQAKESLKVYKRMLANGVMPNAYTYSVLVKGLVKSGDGKMVEEAKKCMVEMMGKGMRPNAGTFVAVVERFVREGEKGEEEGREVVEEMKRRGFSHEESEVREVLKNKRGPVFRKVMDMLFAK